MRYTPCITTYILYSYIYSFSPYYNSVFFPLQASLEGVQLELYQNIIVLVSEVNTCVMYACIIYVILCKCTVRVVSSIPHECSDIFVCVRACLRACVCVQ